jgi:hypothetical protein
MRVCKERLEREKDCFLINFYQYQTNIYKKNNIFSANVSVKFKDVHI